MIYEWWDEEGKRSRKEESLVEIILSFSEVVSCLEEEEAEEISSAKKIWEGNFFSYVVDKDCSFMIVESSLLILLTKEISLK